MSMEVDTGAGLCLMSEATFRCLWPGLDLAYSKEPIPVLGQCNVNIDYQGQTAKMPLLIVEGSGPTVLSWEGTGWTKLGLTGNKFIMFTLHLCKLCWLAIQQSSWKASAR